MLLIYKNKRNALFKSEKFNDVLYKTFNLVSGRVNQYKLLVVSTDIIFINKYLIPLHFLSYQLSSFMLLFRVLTIRSVRNFQEELAILALKKNAHVVIMPCTRPKLIVNTLFRARTPFYFLPLTGRVKHIEQHLWLIRIYGMLRLSKLLKCIK